MVYEVTVTETLSVSYTVEANSKEEADQKFSEWADKNTETIAIDLLDADGNGWDFGEPEECPFMEAQYADIREVDEDDEV